MKKFSEFNKTNKLEESKTKQDYISNLIEETLYHEDGVIKGKDVLVETINNIIKMNDHKTTINVLENIKVLTYNGGLNFTWLNETIEAEKTTLNNLIVERNKTQEIANEITKEELLNKDLIASNLEEIKEVSEEVIETVNFNDDDKLNQNSWADYMSQLNAIPDLFTQITWSLGLILGTVATTGFVGSLLALIGTDISGSEMGEKVKELVAKIKELYKKKGDKNINKEEFAKEVKETINEYSDVVDEINSGKLGKKAEVMGKLLTKVKENAEKLEKEEEEIKESVFYRGFKDQHLMELESLKSIYSEILKESKKEDNE